MSAIFFPLRSSVELFEDPRSPAAATRAKEAAVLYDRLIFETGLYEVTLTPTGSWTWWTPPDQITPEKLEGSRQPVPVGSPFTVTVASQPAQGEPAQGPAHVAVHGPVSIRYAAEFHSRILDELDQFKPAWVETLALGSADNPARSGTVPHRMIEALNFEDFRDDKLLRDFDSFSKSWIYKTFNRDCVVAADFGAAFNVTPLFGPLVERRGASREFAGGDALDILVPNVGSLPWEAVLEYRSHAGSVEARARLREFEEKAAAEEPDDAYRFLKQISREISRGYMAAIKDLAPSLPEDLVKEALLTAVSVSTVIGPVLEKLIALSGAAAEASSFNRSWVAAIMKLSELADDA